MHDVEFVLVHAWSCGAESGTGRAHGGGDDRGGHLWPRSMTAESSSAPCLRC